MTAPRRPSAPRIAFVTGASSGIGAALVRRLLSDGWEVWGTSRQMAGFSIWKTEARFKPVVMDLSDLAGMLDAYRQAEVEGGRFDLAVAISITFDSSSFTNSQFPLSKKIIK